MTERQLRTVTALSIIVFAGLTVALVIALRVPPRAGGLFVAAGAILVIVWIVWSRTREHAGPTDDETDDYGPDDERLATALRSSIRNSISDVDDGPPETLEQAQEAVRRNRVQRLDHHNGFAGD